MEVELSMSYIPILRRRREGVTDYRKRKAIILSRKPFISFMVTGKNIYAHISEPGAQGDKVVASTHSRELMKYGWKGSRKSLPAAYLVGLLLGLKSSKKGLREAIPYLGLKKFVKGSRITAVIKGSIDGGIKIPFDPKSLPDQDRISGASVAKFAKTLLEKDKKIYSGRFSRIIASKISPERYPEHYSEVRGAIIKAYE